MGMSRNLFSVTLIYFYFGFRSTAAGPVHNMCNKKVVGIVLLVIGIVLIAIGIIIGLLLPSIAFKEVEKTTCVNSKDSAGYERWVSKMYVVQYQPRSQGSLLPALRSGRERDQPWERGWYSTPEYTPTNKNLVYLRSGKIGSCILGYLSPI